MGTGCLGDKLLLAICSTADTREKHFIHSCNSGYWPRSAKPTKSCRRLNQHIGEHTAVCGAVAKHPLHANAVRGSHVYELGAAVFESDLQGGDRGEDKSKFGTPEEKHMGNGSVFLAISGDTEECQSHRNRT